jgi:hypothetical protein
MRCVDDGRPEDPFLPFHLSDNRRRRYVDRSWTHGLFEFYAALTLRWVKKNCIQLRAATDLTCGLDAYRPLFYFRTSKE